VGLGEVEEDAVWFAKGLEALVEPGKVGVEEEAGGVVDIAFGVGRELVWEASGIQFSVEGDEDAEESEGSEEAAEWAALCETFCLAEEMETIFSDIPADVG
jgi:hypothetical protein